MAKKQLLEDMCSEPARYFRAPGDVLRDRRFSDPERLEILLSWDRLMGSENGTDAGILGAVRAARHEVERRLGTVPTLGAGATN